MSAPAGIVVRDHAGCAVGRVDGATADQLVAAGAEYAGQRRRRYVRLPAQWDVSFKAVSQHWARIVRVLELYGSGGMRALDHRRTHEAQRCKN